MEHHAYLYQGSLSELPELGADARKRFGFKKEHDPDVRAQESESFGIDEARKLTEAASLKSISGRALFVIGFSGITVEAQQALLKLFEEPQQGTIFVLLAPHGMIIPTLRSRLMEYSRQKESPSQSPRGIASQTIAQDFLSASSKTRSDEIAKMLKDDEGLRERVGDFINALEAELLKKGIEDEKVREGLKDIAKVRSYAGDRSASYKMLLELLATSLPTL